MHMMRVLGLIRPDGLALGAAIGISQIANNFCACSWAGTRTQFYPPGGCQHGNWTVFGPVQNRVKGPGQKQSAKIVAKSVSTPS